MIITLIVIGLLICSIIWYIKSRSIMSHIGVILVNIALIICLTSIGNVQVLKEVKYQSEVFEKETLERRIEIEGIVNNEWLYNDVVEFNNDLKKTKKGVNNPWISWFYDKDIAAIDYVELGAE